VARLTTVKKLQMGNGLVRISAGMVGILLNLCSVGEKQNHMRYCAEEVDPHQPEMRDPRCLGRYVSDGVNIPPDTPVGRHKMW